MHTGIASSKYASYGSVGTREEMLTSRTVPYVLGGMDSDLLRRAAAAVHLPVLKRAKLEKAASILENGASIMEKGASIAEEEAVPMMEEQALPTEEEQALPMVEEVLSMEEEATIVEEKTTIVEEETAIVEEETTIVGQEATIVEERSLPVEDSDSGTTRTSVAAANGSASAAEVSCPHCSRSFKTLAAMHGHKRYCKAFHSQRRNKEIVEPLSETNVETDLAVDLTVDPDQRHHNQPDSGGDQEQRCHNQPSKESQHIPNGRDSETLFDRELGPTMDEATYPEQTPNPMA